MSCTRQKWNWWVFVEIFQHGCLYLQIPKQFLMLLLLVLSTLLFHAFTDHTTLTKKAIASSTSTKVSQGFFVVHTLLNLTDDCLWKISCTNRIHTMSCSFVFFENSSHAGHLVEKSISKPILLFTESVLPMFSKNKSGLHQNSQDWLQYHCQHYEQVKTMPASSQKIHRKCIYAAVHQLNWSGAQCTLCWFLSFSDLHWNTDAKFWSLIKIMVLESTRKLQADRGKGDSLWKINNCYNFI